MGTHTLLFELISLVFDVPSPPPQKKRLNPEDGVEMKENNIQTRGKIK